MSGVEIRRVHDLDEIRLAEGVQHEAWGFTPIDIVPGRFMAVACRNGGMLLGAFDGGRMVGFAFSYPGFREGRAIHCSHMLAVVPGYEGQGIGWRLKLEQRRLVLDEGLDHMAWTFDPLEGRNAWLNLHRLGARAWEYWENLYGHTSSALHTGLDTDRLVARWQLDDPRVLERVRGAVPAVPIEEVLEGGRFDLVSRATWQDGAPHCTEPRLDLRGDLLAIEIPFETRSLRRDHLAVAVEWRCRLRDGLRAYLARGYRVVDFTTGSRDDRRTSFYLLARDREAEESLRRPAASRRER